MFQVPERFRVKSGPFATDESAGNNGIFMLKTPGEYGEVFTVIASDGADWEHVSVSLGHRTPTWEEMCKIKGLFWGNEDRVIQIHPPKDEYVNNHKFCLHLWRKAGTNDYLETPPTILVGLK